MAMAGQASAGTRGFASQLVKMPGTRNRHLRALGFLKMRHKVHYPGTILYTCISVSRDNHDILTNAFTNYMFTFLYLTLSLIELAMRRQSVHTNVSLEQGLLSARGATVSGASPTSP